MTEIVTADIHAGLDPQEIARAAAVEIRMHQRSVVEGVAAIGAALIRVKEALEHGEFLPWLKMEFGWSERTAQNYIAVAERFGSNPQSVADLPLATVYRLASPSVPGTLRDKIGERRQAGETISAAEIDTEIAAAKREAAREREEANKLAKRDPAARERRLKRQQRERERHDAEVAAREKKIDAALSEIESLLVEHLGLAKMHRFVELLDDAPSYRLAAHLQEVLS